MKTIWKLLKKLKIQLLYDPTIPLLGIYLKECKLRHKDTCTVIFIAALFIIAKLWKQPRCLTIDEWVYIFRERERKRERVFYLAIRKNETMWFEGKWIQLEDIVLSEESQAQKGKGPMFFLICERETLCKYKQYYEKQVMQREGH
jgi:hypothetical protein